MRKGQTHTPETREKLRLSHLGKPGFWTGKKRLPTIETCRKRSEAMKGRMPKNIDQIKGWNKGRGGENTDEPRHNISVAKKNGLRYRKLGIKD